MFDIDQDEEILELIQAVHIFTSNLKSAGMSCLNLDKALEKIEEKYGSEIFTYTGLDDPGGPLPPGNYTIDNQGMITTIGPYTGRYIIGAAVKYPERI